MKTNLILAIVVFLLGILAAPPALALGDLQQGSALSDAGLLRKLSFHLRGRPPSAEEYAELQALRSLEERGRFIKTKTDEYLLSPEAQDRMVFRLAELFAIRVPVLGRSVLERLPEGERTTRSEINPASSGPDALTDLFARMSRENLSWDELLTGKSYDLLLGATMFSGNEPDEVNFFRAVVPGLPEPSVSRPNDPEAPRPTPIAVPLRFAADDARVAGALTTPRFISRYNTTNVNKNRRRAAAVFRIFLCDPMFPIIPPPPDKKSSVITQPYPDVDHAGVSEEMLRRSLADADQHGADPKCAACHYKLDPMGLTFQTIGVRLGPVPAPGVLTYRRASGELVKIPVSGIGELGRELVKQPEYVSCQIDWLWRQFIGHDVPLSAARRTELTVSFDAVGRRTNDFLRILVSSPEFRAPPKAVAKVSFAQVAPLLKRCDSCHSASESIPPFASGDISKELLAKMLRRLSLPETDRDRMPRDWRKWDPKDIELVKTWIEQGAVTSTGALGVKNRL